MQENKNWRISYLKNIPRSFWYSLGFAGAFLGIYISWLLRQNSSLPNSVPKDIAVALAALASFVISWIGVKRSPEKHHVDSSRLSLERRLRFWIPLVFSIALFFQVLGNGILIAYDWLNILAPPIWGEAAILGMYPALLAGILLLPRDTIAGKIPLRFVIESAILILTIITFSWYFILEPTLVQRQGEPLFGLVITIALPAFDLLVVSCLILLSHSTVDRSIRTPIRALSLALGIFVLTDSILFYQILHGFQNVWLSLGWICGNFAIGLSVQIMRWRSTSSALQNVPTPAALTLVATPLWRSLLSYVLIPAVIILVFSLWGTDKSSFLAIGTYVCSLLLLLLIFAKQRVTIQETHGLNRGFQRLQHVIEEKNVALQQANAHLEALATTDPLTGLPNHRALLETLEKEVERARRYGHPLSILFFDGDHFKRVNDTHGHAVGDAVLQELGRCGKSVLRGGDTLGRYGGEEFMVLLPETDLTHALEVAERLRVVIATHPLVTGLVEDGLHITISIGIATFPVDGQTGSEVVVKSDQAMYWAKRLGRNQIRTVVEAERAAADSSLVATIANLERSDDGEGQDIEQAMRAYQLSTIHSLMWLLELRDKGISAHSYQVSDLAGAIAQELGLEQKEVFTVSTAGLLHDIGKIAIPDHLLQKEGPLSVSERALIQQHPELGAQILEVGPYLQAMIPAIRHHHENWDGTGYSQALMGEAIPLAARIIRVSEAYQAMISNRSYQARRSTEAARDELKRCSGTCFDPLVVEVALRVLMHQEEEALEGTAVVHPTPLLAANSKPSTFT
jgi:diguanylate cyclase (GGDEF)-like protein/putative nucleotidyltransferase with HDIG domain